jgi:hypothetical protein
MTVYFAQARADKSSVKIGFTSDLAARVKNLSVASPGGVAILATVDGGKETEEYLHEKFSDCRISGEWFRFSDPIRDFIQDVQNGKSGLIPFRDEAVYMRRFTAEYAADALSRARHMALHLINEEHRGVGDTTEAAKYRVEAKTGFPFAWLHRLQYRRDLRDIPAGVYLHLTEIYENERAKHAPDTALVRLADALAGKKTSEELT